MEEKAKKHIAETWPVFPKKQICRQGMEMTSEGGREARGSGRMLGRTGICSRAGLAAR